MGNKLAYASCLILILLSGPAAAQGNASAGAQKVQMCSVCHGPSGNSVNPAWPKLAGQHAEYIAKQLLDFKNSTRSNPQMTPMVAPLSEQDVQNIAAYYARQTVSETPIPAGMELKQVELGEKIYRAGDPSAKLPAYMACHGPGAAGNPAAMYPSLKSQHAAYTAAQLQAFKTESRNNDTNGVMRDIAGKMSNEEIDAVSNYIQGLQ